MVCSSNEVGLRTEAFMATVAIRITQLVFYPFRSKDIASIQSMYMGTDSVNHAKPLSAWRGNALLTMSGLAPSPRDYV